MKHRILNAADRQSYLYMLLVLQDQVAELPNGRISRVLELEAEAEEIESYLEEDKLGRLEMALGI